MLATLLHVGDLVALSMMLCTERIQTAISRIAPVGLTVSLEETGPKFRFLDSHWSIAKNRVNITMHKSNLDFALGISEAPPVTRIVPHAFASLAGDSQLVQHVHGCVARVMQVASVAEDEQMAYAELALEPRGLGYPLGAIEKSFCGCDRHAHARFQAHPQCRSSVAQTACHCGPAGRRYLIVGSSIDIFMRIFFVNGSFIYILLLFFIFLYSFLLVYLFFRAFILVSPLFLLASAFLCVDMFLHICMLSMLYSAFLALSGIGEHTLHSYLVFSSLQTCSAWRPGWGQQQQQQQAPGTTAAGPAGAGATAAATTPRARTGCSSTGSSRG